MVVTPRLAAVNTVVYGEMSQDGNMGDQLSAQDWLNQGLKTLAKSGFTALKAEPLAKAMGVSRGSFYWHFADIGAFQLLLENAVRTWASVDPAARAAVQAIDRRRLGYVEGLLTQSGLSTEIARARAQILYWAFLGFALSDQPLPKAQQQAMIDEMLRMARR
jgi:AcrR family transcriptional regulator